MKKTLEPGFDRWCSTCGEPMKQGSPDHETVVRVVKPGNKYGDAVAGSPVLVEPRHVIGPVIAATWSQDEYAAIEAKKHAPKAPAQPKLSDMVRQGLAASIAQTKAMIDAGKARVAREAERAQEAARSILGVP